MAEIERYERQILLPEWGAAGQEKLRAAKVTVRGTGAAAEAAILYLAGAGVGQLEVEAFADEARALNPFVNVIDSANENENENENVHATSDRAADGCLLAVDTIKAILGL